ncbi:MAG TPA: hypothetical protein VJA87_01635 [Candidatus Paceibacterota bacterium]
MKKYLLGTLALAALVAFPAASFAAMYAYVNQDGEVRTVEAANANTSIMTAPAIDEHSGVLLLDSAADEDIVGDSVGGV